MPLEHIKVRSSWQKFRHGEVAAVIVPVMSRFNRVVAVDVPHHVTQRGNGRRFIWTAMPTERFTLSSCTRIWASNGVALTRILPDVLPCSLDRYPYEGRGIS